MKYSHKACIKTLYFVKVVFQLHLEGSRCFVLSADERDGRGTGGQGHGVGDQPTAGAAAQGNLPGRGSWITRATQAQARRVSPY